MVEVGMGQQHPAEPAKAEPGSQELALRAFAAIDEQPARAMADHEGR
jgi:hypothetical protein